MFKPSSQFWQIISIFAFVFIAFMVGVDFGKNRETSPIAKQIQHSESHPANPGDSKISFLKTELSSAEKNLSFRALGEETIADIAEQAAPSVVNIELSRVFPQDQRNWLPNSELNFGKKDKTGGVKVPNDDKSHFNPNISPTIPGSGFHTLSSGSGLIIRPDGYIVTNNHLMRTGYEIKVTLSDQRAFKAKLIGQDIFTDLAVLKIDADHLPVVPFANGEQQAVRPGDWAIVIGNPLGYDHTVTLGIISAVHRSLVDLNAHVELIQTDAAINPGNSGGPLLNIHGEIIGLASAIRNDAQNIGFAIPVAVVEQVSRSLIKEGTITRPYLGVFMKDFDNRIISDPRLPADIKGVMARSVVADGPAQHAGVGAGDFIVSFDGVEVSCAQQIRNITQKHKPGDKVRLSIIHEKKRADKLLTVGSYPTNGNIPIERERE